jgi:hypothetical protein
VTEKRPAPAAGGSELAKVHWKAVLTELADTEPDTPQAETVLLSEVAFLTTQAAVSRDRQGLRRFRQWLVDFIRPVLSTLDEADVILEVDRVRSDQEIQ